MTQVNTPNRAISRRTLARGAAWAAPAVAATAVIPAYAASSCAPDADPTGGIYVDWGTIGYGPTTRSLTINAETVVKGLPEGVTVTKVEHRWLIQQSAAGSAAPGIPAIGDISSNRVTQVRRGNITHQPGAAGWNAVATTTGTTTNMQYSGLNGVDGGTYNFWDLTFMWNAPRNTAGNYSKDSATGCITFTTGDSGLFDIGYSNLPALTQAQCSSSTEGHLRYVNQMTVYLSGGSTVKTNLWAQSSVTCANSKGWY